MCQRFIDSAGPALWWLKNSKEEKKTHIFFFFFYWEYFIHNPKETPHCVQVCQRKPEGFDLRLWSQGEDINEV